MIDRRIPRTLEEFRQLKDKSIDQPANAALVRVAIIGSPNVGKSTLLNELVNWKVSAASSRVHTTRNKVVGVYVQDNVQIEFLDTPGLVDRKHMKRHNLDSEFIDALQASALQADILCTVVDVSNKREQAKLNYGLLKLLHANRDKESLLVLNKVDRIKHKMRLLEMTHTLTSGFVGGQEVRQLANDSLQDEIKSRHFKTLFEQTEKYLAYKDQEHDVLEPEKLTDKIGWPNFARVFMISALHNDGVDQLRTYLLDQARPRPWLYNRDVITLQNPRHMIIECLREACLERFYQEIPYQFHYKLVHWETDPDLGNMSIIMNIYCQPKFQSLVIGPKGTTIAAVMRQCREAIANTFQCDVSLRVGVKALMSTNIFHKR